MLSWQNDDYKYLNEHNYEKISILHGCDFNSKYNIINIFAADQFKNRVIWLNGIESSNATPYLPFINLFSGEQLNLFKKLGRAFIKDITKSETATVIYDKVLNNTSDFVLLDNRIVGILSILNNACKRKPLALMITNFEEFDEYSIELIKLLIADRFKNIFRNLYNIKLYFLCEYEELGDQYDFVRKFSHIEYNLSCPTKENIKEFLTVYFPNIVESLNDLDKFYHYCGGKLTYCEILAEYFIRNKKTEISDIADIDLIYSVLSNRLYAMGNLGETLSYALKLASEIGEEFSLEIISNALNVKNNLNSIVKKAKKEYLLKLIGDNRYKFYYPIIWSFFIDLATKTLKSGDYISLERAIYSFNAKDYITRAILFKKADMKQDAAEMYLLEYYQSWVSGIRMSEKLKEDVQKACEESGLNWMFNNLTLYISFINNKQYIKALNVFDNGVYNSNRLQIVKHLLTGYALYRSSNSNQELSLALNKINEAANSSFNFEMGLWSECANLLISLEININGDLIKAVRWYDKLIDYYELQQCDEAKVQLNILKRKAAATCSVERAFIKTQESVTFFQNTYHLSEYVMALNNNAANALILGKLDIAYDSISKAKSILENTPLCIANANYILTNYCTINVLRDYASCEQSTLLLLKSLSDSEDASWKIIPLINCAIFLALQGKYDDAKVQLTKATILNKDINDDYYEYYIQINRAALYYLEGDKDIAISILQEYSKSDKIPKLFKTSEKHYLIKRSELWMDIMKTYDITNPIEFNDFLRYKDIGGNQWDVTSRGFLVSDIQFWSET